MADGRHHWYCGPGDGAHHDLFIEAPEILQRPASTPHDHDIDLAGRAECPDSASDQRCRGFPLDRHRRDQQAHRWTATCEYGQNVTDGRARQGGHEANPAREKWQRPFPGLVKQPLKGKFFLQLFQGDLECADSLGFHVIQNHLVLSPWLIDRQTPAHDDLKSLAQGESQALRSGFEQHSSELALLILEGEIEMAGGRRTQVGNFTLHPDIRKPFLKSVPDQEGQLGYRENPFRLNAHEYSR